jgi:hypothetical protein
MTRPVLEPTNARDFARMGFTDDQLLRRPASSSGGGIVLNIKVFRDDDEVVVGDGAFIFAISEDMDGAVLQSVEIYVTTVSSSGIVQVQLRNITQGADMLSTRVQIDAGEKNSADAATVYVINPTFADVVWEDEIAIDVDAAGTDAKGLGVILDFGGVQVLSGSLDLENIAAGDIDSGAATAGEVLTADGAGNATWEAPTPADAVQGTITQTTHGLAVGNVVRHSGTLYVKAQANSEPNAEVIGIVAAVADVNTFTLHYMGRITGLSGLTAGTVYYLDDDTAGLLTATEPLDPGDVSKPVLIADSTTSGVFVNLRGVLVP